MVADTVDGMVDTLFTDVEPARIFQPQPWSPLLVPRAAIEQKINDLLDKEMAPGLHRASEVVHPRAREFGHGIAPGLSISINVLRPGESLKLNRDNGNRVEFAIHGAATALVGDRSLDVEKWTTWTVPSMVRRAYRNDGKQPFVWLSYSNRPLLDRIGIYYSDMADAVPKRRVRDGAVSNDYIREDAPDFPILRDGARLRGYEYLTDIEVVENKALVWPWPEILPHMCREEGDGKRTIMLLYNPATGRRAGTTHSFFATITSFPPGRLRPPPARGHRHSSFATNYHFQGGGSSIVDGQTFQWEAGDLMLSAPSWSEHSHGFAPEGAMVLTVQDHPFQIGIESLIWQERMDGPILTLGSEPGQTGYVGPRLEGE